MIREWLHGLRALARRAGTTMAIVATLALGIGAVTAIVSLLDTVLYRPLGYPEGPRLVELRQTLDALRTSPNPRLQAIWDRLPVSYQNAVEWRRESRTLVDIGLYAERTVTVQGLGEPEAIDGAEVDTELLTTLGIKPIRGRAFTTEDVTSHAPVLLIGHALWQRAWGGARSAIGATVRLDGVPHTVIGVMPAGFDIAGGRDDHLWIPLRLEAADFEARDHQRLRSIARLAEGVSLADAAAELDRLATAQATAWPGTNEGVGASLQPLREVLVGEESRAVLPVLLAAVVAVLAVACANVAHLLLAQTHRRRDEWALRRALGAGRGRLVRQVLIESLSPALLGGGLGLLVAYLGRDLLLTWLPVELPRAAAIPIDGRAFVVALAASLLSAVLCGVPAAWTSARLAIRGGQDRPTRSGFHVHELLMITEIALTLILAWAAILLGHSVSRLSAVDPGFRAEGLLIQDLRLPLWSYPEEPQRQQFAETLVERLSALPGVDSVALTSKLPFAGPALVAGFTIPGTEAADGDWTQGPSASVKFVTPGYFATLGITIEAGRAFEAADRPERGRVVVINRTLAQRGWPEIDPIGKTLEFPDHPLTIVGVAADIQHDGVGETPGALLYFPWRQRVDMAAMADRLTLIIEPATASATEANGTLGATLRDVVREIDPTLPMAAVTTIEALMADSLAVPRSRAALVTLLAGLALILAVVGTYAIVVFTVSRRTREIGIRMALGADASRVVRQVLGRILGLSLIGIGLGLVGTRVAGPWLDSLLWGVEATEPSALIGAALVLIVAAVAAGLLPALRATRIEVVEALREP